MATTSVSSVSRKDGSFRAMTTVIPGEHSILHALHRYQKTFGNEYGSCTKCELKHLAKKIASSTDDGLKFLADDPELSHAQRSLVGRVSKFSRRKGGDAVIIEGPKASDGANKDMHLGFIARGRTPLEAAILRTKQKLYVSRSNPDPNATELAFLKEQYRRPISGAVPVWSIKQEPSENTEMSTQFKSIHPMGDNDLVGFFNGNKPREILPENALNRIQQQLIRSIASIHERGIIHGDIKPDNTIITTSLPKHLTRSLKGDSAVFTSQDTQFEVRMCDFAFSRKTDDPPLAKPRGSPPYIAPEVANHVLEQKADPRKIVPHSQSADVWSAGLILLSLQDFDTFSKVVPFDDADEAAKAAADAAARSAQTNKIFWVRYQKYFQTNNIPGFPEPEDKKSGLHWIWRMLRPKPEDRPTMREVCQNFPVLDTPREPNENRPTMRGVYQNFPVSDTPIEPDEDLLPCLANFLCIVV
jgi:serine/threonine protein kinase